MSTARSTSSAMSTAAATSLCSCSNGSGTRRPVLEGDDPAWGSRAYAHPEGRKAVFLGDLVDRGPRILDTVRLVRNMVLQGSALCVPGNHDLKLVRKLTGKNVQITHGLADTLAEIDALPGEVRPTLVRGSPNSSTGLVSHYVLDDGRLVAAHAGMKEEMQGRGFGQGPGFRPLRRDHRRDRRVRPARPLRLGQGVSWAGGGRLRPHARPRAGMAEPDGQHRHRLRLRRQADRPPLPRAGVRLGPRRPDLLRTGTSLPARRAAGPGPVGAAGPRSGARRRGRAGQADRLDPAAGQRHDPGGERRSGPGGDEPVRRRPQVADLPAAPPCPPCETSGEPGLLEHPAEAVAYYRSQGAPQVVCEEKHMGSRAVVIACRDGEVARERFGVTTAEVGIVYTRTGRRFFNDADLERRFLDRVREALTAADLWGKLETSWACLDCELMPWSAKAQELLRAQYAAVGAAGSASLPRAVSALEQAAGRLAGPEKDNLGRRRGHLPSPWAGHRAIRRRLPPVLLDGRVTVRSEAGPVPTCSPPRGMSTRTRATPGTWRPWPRSAGPIPNSCGRPRTWSWT